MNPKQLTEQIEESIQLELNIAELYKLFSDKLPEDHDFWWQLYMEERSHASLIRAARDSFIKRDKFPNDLISESLDALKASNAAAIDQINRFTDKLPSRTEACRAAIKLEQESGEMHYTEFMERETNGVMESVFKQLNRDDKDHEKRIRAHLETLTDEN